MLCHKVTTALHFVDPTSLHSVELDAKQYFRYKFNAIANVKQCTVFYVQAVMPIKNATAHKKWKCAELELVREAELGDPNAAVLDTVTHLGGLLKPGDMVAGYDLERLATHNDLRHHKDLRGFLRKARLPDVVVVKKHYEYRSKAQRRKWRLKRMAKEREGSVDKYTAEREQRDNEMFMREIEQDFELRCQIKVYRDPKHQGGNADQETDDERPQIPDSELIDEMSEMKIAENDGDVKELDEFLMDTT